MPDVTYPKNPNSDTVFVEDGGQKTRAVKTVQLDGTVDYPSNPNSDSCYVTVDGKKQRALMVADISSAGTLEYSNNENSTKGYVTVDGKKHRVNLTASLVGGGSTPVIEELNVTPSTSAQTITAPSGTDGYSPVKVSAVTSSIDANISAGNIKKDVTILGVTGSYEGQQPSGTLPITNNGTYDVTNYASADVQVPVGAVPNYYGKRTIDENGILKYDVTQTTFSTSPATSVSSGALAGVLSHRTTAVVVDCSSLTTVGGTYAFSHAFDGCKASSFDFSNIQTVTGANAFEYAFANIPSSGSGYATSVTFSSLTRISGMYAFQFAFSNNLKIQSVSFPAITRIGGTTPFYETFYFSGITSLTIGNTAAITFDNAYVFSDMFGGCTQEITVNAPLASKTDIEALDGYPDFGAYTPVVWNWVS